MEMGKGGDNSGERVNLEDFFRRFKQAQGKQQQHGGRDESREKDGGCEQRQETDRDERERLRGGIGQGKGMRKGQGKGKGEIDEQKDWEERWRVKKENWMNEQWGRMSEDDLGMGQTGERLRQEQWEAVRAMKLRNEMLRMAECLGEELASELGRQSWRGARDVRRGERGGESPAGQSGDDSVEEKIRRLTERIDELEGKDKKKEEGRVVSLVAQGRL